MERIEKWLQLSIIVLLIIGTLIAWSPWLNSERAKAWAISNFNAGQIGISDGCGVIDAVAIKKELFGYRVHLLYGCGLKPIDSKEPPMSKTVFVTAVGLV